ncbi:MAG: RNA polymerase sigma factor [Clostridiales bacterium]|nr:RNA polymerase sigma factor [Clostridiales bacterium]
MTNQDFAARIIAMQGTLYRVTCSLLREHADREDAVQSAIEKAWRKSGTLRDESRLQPWVVRILINECYTILRHQKRETPVEAIPDAPAPLTADPDLYRFFTDLPDKLRLTMVLHYVEGYDVKEIARMQRIPVGTVKTRLMRGREKMKENNTLKEVQD